LQGDARPFHQQEELVGDPLRPRVSRLAHQRDQALALAALVHLDHPARRVLAPGELDRGVGERAAAHARFARPLRHLPQQIAQLRLGVAGVLGARLVPHPFALGGERREIRRDQLVARAEMAVERHLVGAGSGGDGIDAHRVDAIAVEKLARRLQNTSARRRFLHLSFQTSHA